MAYAYSMLDDMMGTSNNPQKQDIFAQPGQQTGQNNDVASGGQEGAKTSTEGDLSTGGASAPKANPASAPTVQEGGATAANKTTQAAYKANVGKTKAPDTLNTIQSGLTEAQTGLQKQAADYAAAQAASHNYGLDQSVAEKAVKDQDQAAKGSVLGLLGKATAEPIEEFKPTGINVKDVDLLNSQAGIKNLVSRGRNPVYSPNMAAFDAMLLQADPNFQRQVSGIKGQAGELQRAAGETATKAQADAEAAAQANLSKSQQDIKDYLLGFKGNILSEEALAAEQANAALPGQIEAVKAKAAADARAAAEAKARQALSQNFGGSRSEAQLQAALKGIDPNQYLDFIQSYKPEQFIKQNQANQFNTINELLGLGGQAQVASGDLPELYSTRGEDLYNSLIGKATDLRKQADVTGQASIKQIMDQANAAAAADNARRLGLTQNYGKDVQKTANQILQEQLGADPAVKAGFYGYSPELQSLVDQAVQGYTQNKPASAFASLGNPKLMGQEMYTQKQADQLNALAKDLGQGQVYQAGQYAQGGAQSLIDKKALQDLISSTVGSYRESQKQKADKAAQEKAIDEWMKNVAPNILAGGSSQGSMIPGPENAFGQKVNQDLTGLRNPLSVLRNPNPFA